MKNGECCRWVNGGKKRRAGGEGRGGLLPVLCVLRLENVKCRLTELAGLHDSVNAEVL